MNSKQKLMEETQPQFRPKINNTTKKRKDANEQDRFQKLYEDSKTLKKKKTLM
jgi:hypothetical protein